MKKNPTLAILGGGSWGTALIKLISQNVETLGWWIRDEADVIHIELHNHNPKYLSDVE